MQFYPRNCDVLWIGIKISRNTCSALADSSFYFLRDRSSTTEISCLTSYRRMLSLIQQMLGCLLAVHTLLDTHSFTLMKSISRQEYPPFKKISGISSEDPLTTLS